MTTTTTLTERYISATIRSLPPEAQGDVRVESGGAQVDAGMDKRWRRAVAALGLVSTWYAGERDAG